MEILLAVAAVAAGLMLARRGFLDPWDYAVAAGIALTLAVTFQIAIPDDRQMHVLLQLGAPRTTLAGADYMMAHGETIVLSLIVFAVGFGADALARRHVTAHPLA